MLECGAVSAAGLHAGRVGNAAARLSQRVSCRPAAGLRQDGLVFSGEYIWKYTHNAFDFSVLGNTPIFFPIDWHNSKIPGYALHADIPQFHNFSAYFVASSVAARFFPPQSAGAGAAPQTAASPSASTTTKSSTRPRTCNTRFGKRGPWAGWNWRYDSGLVAGSVPFATDTTTPVDLSGLTYDQQAEAGITCNGVKATRTAGFQSCAPSQYSSIAGQHSGAGHGKRRQEPAAHRAAQPVRRSPSVRTISSTPNRYKVDFDLTAINVTNKYALYNFLSTFSGTHYVTPRALTAKITLNF